MLTILRPLSTSELLDRTFHQYKNDFLVFFTIVAIPQLVLFAVKLLYTESIQGMTRGSIIVLAVPVSHCLRISVVDRSWRVLDAKVRSHHAVRGSRGHRTQ